MLTNMNLEHLTKCLLSTMSNDMAIRKPAENYILDMEKTNGFSEFLMTIIKGNNNSIEMKLASAISFKNFIKRNWLTDDNHDDKILKEERDLVRNNIIELMLASPQLIQNQLSEAVSIIAKQDFPDRWEGLLPQLVNKINEGNFGIINGVLNTCHSLFKRYRHESRSDTLWLGIKEIIAKLASPLTQLIQQTIALVPQHINDKNAVSVLWNSLLLISKIFFSLNYQDLPEYFEDNMKVWMEQFHIILTSLPFILVGDTDEPCVVEDVKSQICDILSLYASKYDEEFTDYLRVFVEDIYLMMLSTNASPRFDSLVTSALHFLSIVADKPQHRTTFSSIVDIQQLCQQIIIPNVEFQLSDQETFEDNPEEYIRRDIEGSNAHTRRKSSCELVKSLNRFQENQVVANFGAYIQQLLSNYVENPSSNWKMKDSALFLVTSVASRGETERFGVTTTTELVDIKSFYQGHILPELQNINGNPVIKADCIKYLMTFRNLLTPEDLRLAINLLSKFASSESHVVHSYAAAAINKLLMVKMDPKLPIATICGPHITSPTTFVASLCATMNIDGSQDNAYSMQAIARTLSTLQSLSLPAMNHLVPFLATKLSLVVKNPRKPLFNHFLIESIALSIKFVCADNASHVTHFEGLLCPIFNDVLCGDIEEFIPYAFQLFSVMLDYHQGGQVPVAYIELFPFLMHPALWTKSDNIPSLIRLLLSYLEKTDGSIIVDKLRELVSIFEKLNNSRGLDSFGFSLMTAVVMYVPRSHTEPFLRQVFLAIFSRLSKNKTVKYLRGFLIFLASIVQFYSANDIVALINSFQVNLFQMTLDSVILPTIPMITDGQEKKIVTIGMTKMVTECTDLMVNGAYGSYWSQLVARIAAVLSSYDDSATKVAEAHFLDIGDVTAAASNDTKFNQLIFVGRKTVDPYTGVGDPRHFLCHTLKTLSAVDGQQFSVLYGSLDEATVHTIKMLMAAHT